MADGLSMIAPDPDAVVMYKADLLPVDVLPNYDGADEVPNFIWPHGSHYHGYYPWLFGEAYLSAPIEIFFAHVEKTHAHLEWCKDTYWDVGIGGKRFERFYIPYKCPITLIEA